MITARPFTAALFAALLAACSAHRPASLYGPSDATPDASFEQVLRTWTRDAKVYRGLENKLFIYATYHSPELRRAFAHAFPDIYGHGGEITRRELVDLTGDVEQYHTFFVVMYTPDEKWNDIAQEESIWRLTLQSSTGVMIGPRKIVPVKIDENLRVVYEHIDRFDRAYLVRFPLADPLGAITIGPDTTRFALRIASALGSAEMEWELIPAAQAAGAPPGPEAP